MKRFAFLSLTLMVLLSFSFAKEWIAKDDGSTDIPLCNDITAAENSEFICTSNLASGLLNSQGLLIFKTSSDGNIIWAKKIETNESNDYFNTGRSIQKTDDGNFILAGGGNNNVYVAKITSNGNVLWQKNFDFNPYYAERATAIKQTLDGGYIVACEVNDPYIMKLDQDGNYQWGEKIRVLGANAANDIIQDSEQDFIIAGSGNGLKNLYLAKIRKTDVGFSMIWQYEINYPYNDTIKAITKISDGEYLLIGQIRDSEEGGYFYVARISVDENNLSIKWHKTFGKGVGQKLILTDDGGVLAMGYNFNYPRSIVLVRFSDLQGTVAWQKTISTGNDIYATALAQLSDKSIIVGGSDYNRTSDSLNLLLAKLDSHGNINNPACNIVESVDLEQVPDNPDVEIPRYTLESLTPNQINLTTTPQDISFGLVFLCESAQTSYTVPLDPKAKLFLIIALALGALFYMSHYRFHNKA